MARPFVRLLPKIVVRFIYFVFLAVPLAQARNYEYFWLGEDFEAHEQFDVVLADAIGAAADAYRGCCGLLVQRD